VAETNLDGRFVLVNKRVCGMLDLSDHERPPTVPRQADRTSSATGMALADLRSSATTRKDAA
jgi:hypothetical protein